MDFYSVYWAEKGQFWVQASVRTNLGSQQSRGTLEQGTDPTSTKLGFWMSWQLTQRCPLPSPISSFERLGTFPATPLRDKAAKQNRLEM